jgi:spore coat polysaccharide biosynthesis predicted glycosyltransferase SpsG
MRCLAIYEELEIRNWQCYFAMNKQSASQPLVQAYQKTIFIIPDNKHLNPLALKRLYPAGVSWLVLDNYDFDSTFAAGIDGWARSIAWFQDLPEQDVAANFVIGHESPHALSVFGPDFIPLRSSVRELRNKLSAADEPEATRIAVFFGGVDSHCLSALFCDYLIEVFPDWDVDVVASSVSRSLGYLKKVSSKYQKVNVHVDAASPASIMSKACFAIGAGGVNAYERCALGLPSLIIETSNNQLASARNLRDNNCAMLLSLEDCNQRNILSCLSKFKSRKLRREMRAAAWDVCDAKGAERIADIICQWNFKVR